MTEYSIKRQNGSDTVSKVNQSLEKVFPSIDAVEEAIANGEMKDGELFSTIDDSRPNRTSDETIRDLQIDVEHIYESINQIDSLLPPDASTENLIASINEVLRCIANLDASIVGGSGKYVKSISQTDGVISATEGTIDTVVTASSGNLITSGAVDSALSASETTLQGNINAVSAKISSSASSSDKVPAMSEVTSAISTSETTLQGNIDAVTAKISSNASSSDKMPAMSEVTSAITNAINALDVSSAGGAGQYIQAISETDGKISATAQTFPTVAAFTLSGTDLIITY